MATKENDEFILKLGPGSGSFMVYPYRVGIMIADGITESIFEGETRRLPRGEVRTHVISTSPFKVTFRLRAPGDSPRFDDLEPDPPLLTSDGQQISGRIDFTLSVMPEAAYRLLQLLGLDGEDITMSDLAGAAEDELLPQLLSGGFQRYTAAELRENRDLLQQISNSLRVGLTSALDRFGLELTDFYANWGPIPVEEEPVSPPERRDARVAAGTPPKTPGPVNKSEGSGPIPQAAPRREGRL